MASATSTARAVVAVAVLAGAALGAGCYRPTIDSPGFACNAKGKACPDGFACSKANNLCYAIEDLPDAAPIVHPAPHKPPTDLGPDTATIAAGDSTRLAHQFALALTTTIVGLVARMLVSGFTPRQEEAIDQAERALAEASLRLSEQLDAFAARTNTQIGATDVFLRRLLASTQAAVEAQLKAFESLPARVRHLVASNDRGGEFLWKLLRDVFLYSAERVAEIADRVVEIDRAMRWGYAFELGPFELWDALGFEQTARRIEAERPLPLAAASMLSGTSSSPHSSMSHWSFSSSVRSS